MGAKGSSGHLLKGKKIINNYEKNNSNKIEIKFFNNIIDDSYARYIKRNSFCIFKSIEEILYLVYSTINYSIVFYNMIDSKKINIIKNAHNKHITNFRYFLDSSNERDLLLSISLDNLNLKIWNVNRCECLLNIEKVYEKGGLHSASFLNYNNQIYIIVGNENLDNCENIKVFDLNGNLVKEINNSNYNVNYIDIFYDSQNNKIYILICNDDNVKSYDYKLNKIYKIYGEEIENYYEEIDNYHNYLIINKNEELIESNTNGTIQIWDFHSARLLRKIKDPCDSFQCFCFLNNKYLLAGLNKNNLSLIEIKSGKAIKNLIGHKEEIIEIINIDHPKYGHILITQGYGEDYIKLWKINTIN